MIEFLIEEAHLAIAEFHLSRVRRNGLFDWDEEVPISIWSFQEFRARLKERLLRFKWKMTGRNRYGQTPQEAADWVEKNESPTHPNCRCVVISHDADRNREQREDL